VLTVGLWLVLTVGFWLELTSGFWLELTVRFSLELTVGFWLGLVVARLLKWFAGGITPFPPRLLAFHMRVSEHKNCTEGLKVG
jgi:hypothetical protein